MKFVVLSAILVTVQGLSLPPNFKTCNRKSENFKSCLLEAARQGLKQLDRDYNSLKMPNLNPLTIPKIEAHVRVPTSNISCILENCKFYGLIDTEIQNFEFDFEKKFVKLDAVFPVLKSECHYKTDGKILGTTAKGEGEGSSIFKNFKWTFNMTYNEVPRRGKTYVKPVTTFFDGKPEYLNIQMENLFGGDKELGDRTNKIINDNWSELYDDVKGTYLDNAKQTWLQLLNGWFTKISLEEAFDN